MVGFERIAVVGLGYVGFPAAVSFALRGLIVAGIDVDKSKVDSINGGRCPSEEQAVCEAYFKAWSSGRLKAYSSYDPIREADAIIFALPTPVKRGVVDLSILESAVERTAGLLKRGVLVSIESTVPPGTTRRLASRIEEITGFRLGRDFYMVHVPERIAPGKSLEEMAAIPRIVGGLDEASTRLGLELYSVVNSSPIPATAEEAELSKLVENSYRDLNIAFANFIALTAERVGVDAWHVIRLANSHPRVNVHLPGAGVGGPCLTKDPYMLANVGASIPGSELLTLARIVNDLMPWHMVELTLKALGDHGIEVSGARVTVLGSAYKGGIGDTRASPSERIVRGLLGYGARVVVSDPYTSESYGAEYTRDPYDAVRGADAIVVATDHPEYRSLDWHRVARLARTPILVDGRRVVEPEEAESAGLHYYGVGYPR